MKFLANIYDPKGADAGWSIVCMEYETLEEAKARRDRWLSDKVLGLPQATDDYTVEELVEMGYVGVYCLDDKVAVDHLEIEE